MEIPKEELIGVLSQFNPWWRGEAIADLPRWRRAAFRDLYEWITIPPAPRALMLSGARQVGKTTLLQQAIEKLLTEGVSPANILYATFDHPFLKLAGVDAVINAWREREPKIGGMEYIFLDEVQFIKDWGTWVKIQVDFNKQRRIIFTGSAMPLSKDSQESGVGRWHAIKLTTLSFYEYLQIKKLELPPIPPVNSLTALFGWDSKLFYSCRELASAYIGHFHEYLLRGGFPQTSLVESLTQAQRLLREDIIDKVLKRDMTAMFGVRRVVELEHTFLYLCMHDGGLLDMTNLCANLSVTRQTAQNYIEHLEAAHLIYKLPPYGYGKDVLRGKFKIYLADAAIVPAVMLKGKTVLEDATALGSLTETAVFKHLFARYYTQNVKFSYWRDKKNNEVDLVAEVAGDMIPFEVKYRAQHTDLKDLKGLVNLIDSKKLSRGYVVTKSLDDFGAMNYPNSEKKIIMKIPAPLLCYWMGLSELGSFASD
ncbi:MAG: ATP-binding protein [Solidesulfovibrio sp. DCME]|uniref:ATP-binding protein n=1 Tax=Solidesulfovibrio sp. DCME TaxID=3447380 RepID=UPI003D09C1F1